MASSGKIRVDFICVHNARRSQMAAAFAEQEQDRRGLDDIVEIHSGGTSPADEIDETVVEAMAARDIDISDRQPKYIVLEDLKQSHFLITMGCSIREFEPAHYGVESRQWDLTDPADKDVETVEAVRDEIEERVAALFDEIEQTANEQAAQKSLSTRVRTAVRDAFSL
jgi:protein-tyrosine-phosphatase